MSVAVLAMSPSTLPARFMKLTPSFIRLSTWQQQQQVRQQKVSFSGSSASMHNTSPAYFKQSTLASHPLCNNKSHVCVQYTTANRSLG
jgi:hypothetical protein